jgi:hypothetical protein
VPSTHFSQKKTIVFQYPGWEDQEGFEWVKSESPKGKELNASKRSSLTSAKGCRAQLRDAVHRLLLIRVTSV